jgi:plastocyanin
MHHTRLAVVATAIAACCLTSLPFAQARGTKVIKAIPFAYLGTSVNRVTVERHTRLQLENLDLLGAHTVTSDTNNLFKSPVVEFGETGTVSGVIVLPPGDYKFHCLVQPSMHGILTVE